MYRALLLFCLIPFAACGKDPLADAKKMERLGRYPSALAAYETLAAQNKPGSAEARYRSAEIYRAVLRDYSRARSLYSEIIAKHNGTPWSDKAKQSLMHCPDYFPLQPDYIRRTGDSQSGGKYMHTEEELEAIANPPGRFKLKRKIFAGTQLVSTFERIYENSETALREFPLGPGDGSVILSYPIETGKRWETVRDGKKTIFEIESDDAVVTIGAGEFTRCLKLRIRNAAEDESWKTEYYAPDIGFILAAAATENGETRVSELLSYLNKKSLLTPPPAAAKPGLWQRLKTRFKKRPAP